MGGGGGGGVAGHSTLPSDFASYRYDRLEE